MKVRMKVNKTFQIIVLLVVVSLMTVGSAFADSYPTVKTSTRCINGYLFAVAVISVKTSQSGSGVSIVQVMGQSQTTWGTIATPIKCN